MGKELFEKRCPGCGVFFWGGIQRRFCDKCATKSKSKIRRDRVRRRGRIYVSDPYSLSLRRGFAL